MQYNITEGKKKKKKQDKVCKTFLLKVQYPNWGQDLCKCQNYNYNIALLWKS